MATLFAAILRTSGCPWPPTRKNGASLTLPWSGCIFRAPDTPPWETAQNHLNGEADDAISFCIVAVSLRLKQLYVTRKVLAELTSRPHLAWVFAPQGADQNLSAFSIVRLNAARIPRVSGKKSPCANCVPAASGLGFHPPGCGPKPVRFFNRPSECRSHPPPLRQEIAVRELRPSRIWLGFSPSRVRTKTCPLFQSSV